MARKMTNANPENLTPYPITLARSLAGKKFPAPYSASSTPLPSHPSPTQSQLTQMPGKLVECSRSSVKREKQSHQLQTFL